MNPPPVHLSIHQSIHPPVHSCVICFCNLQASSCTTPDSDPKVPPEPAHGHLVHGLHVGGRLRAQPGAAHVRRQEDPPLHGHYGVVGYFLSCRSVATILHSLASVRPASLSCDPFVLAYHVSWPRQSVLPVGRASWSCQSVVPVGRARLSCRPVVPVGQASQSCLSCCA